ncbi:HpaA family protein [Helicobacter vulpis]|uniref:HpaA family protein n=1 Tax=Helicobacter vulpis TaxID=2316076 RepID=UPI000EB54988|nr:HpaA family protein [Helicobacter vulpis]
MYKKVVLCAFLGVAGLAYAAEHHATTDKYVYELHEKVQPKNHYTLALAPLSLDFSKNVSAALQDKFTKSLQEQLAQMLKNRGFSVFTGAKLSPEQQDEVFAVVHVSAFINILEDADMKLTQNNQGIEEDFTDVSAGFLRLKLVEPKSNNAFHMASIELPSFKVKTHTVIRRQRTSSGGFMPVSQSVSVRDKNFDKHVDAVLSKVYARSVAKLSQDLMPQNLKPFKHLVENFKQTKSH